MKPITLNDLPQYSKWPSILLENTGNKKYFKTTEAVVREFNVEKWGELLTRVEKNPELTVQKLEEQMFEDHSETSFYENKRFFLTSALHARKKYFKLCASTIIEYFKDSSALVEFGAGYGSIILNLAKLPVFSRIACLAGEYTSNGVELIQKLAKNDNVNIEVGFCDFREMTYKDIEIPEGSVIFTSYSLHYVPRLSDEIIGYFLRWKPRAVIHFEPCYEHYETNKLHGLMCRRYVEFNDYNTNLISVLHNAQENKLINILKEDKCVLGSNPLLPISVIVWTGC